MDTAFEYLSAGIILSLILGVTTVFSNNMTSVKLNSIEQSSSFSIADKMVDFLLLSSGTPNNWGRTLDNPQTIGLALENAVKPYQLDRSKVKRLSNTSDAYIAPYEVRDLLGLSPNYYIKVEIYPMYNILIEQNTPEKFTVTVTNQWNVPVSALNVTGAYTTIENVNATEITSFINGDLTNAVTQSKLTNVAGHCTLDYSDTGAKRTLIVMVNQLNVKSLAIWPESSPDLIGTINSSMGDSSDFNVEMVYRTVEINGMNYICRFTLWWT